MKTLTVLLWLAFVSFCTIAHVAGNLCRGVRCDVEFTTIGCYKDTANRALPNYIYNERDPTIKNYGGRKIDWFNWNEYFPGFACRCAEKAKQLGYNLFGLQFYGECWAGNSNQDNYEKHGADTKGCIQDDFQECHKGTRYCMGKQWRNMVYRIEDTSCPTVAFEKVGCFRDLHRKLARPLPEYIANDRDPTVKTGFSGKRIDWRNWDMFVPDFACRCAMKAKEKNYTFFGMQFYGECWSGPDSHLTYYRDGISGSRCVDQCFQPCTKSSPFCSGTGFANYVYRIRDGSCEVNISPVGCYKENKENLAMQGIFHNEAAPDKPEFAGNMLQFSDKYEVDFPEFLCRCARKAQIFGWGYFGVRELGLCVRSSPDITNYDKYGESDKCFESKSSTQTCPSGSKLCGGRDTEANYVYRITFPGTDVEWKGSGAAEDEAYHNQRYSSKIIQQDYTHP